MNAVKSLIVWVLIIISVAMFYDSYRDELNDRFFSTFAPYSSKGRVQGNGSIEFRRSHDGHFYIQAQINNRSVIFLLDTGATDIVLSQQDAFRLGINLQNVKNFKTYETAKGKIEAGIVTLPQIKIGNFLINDIQASVNTHSMSHSLLGMSFLKYFDFIVKDDKLILYHG